MDKTILERRLPFLLKPVAKDYIWGGSRLNDDFRFEIDINPFAEAWVCSTHEDGSSYIDSGEDLRTVLKKQPGLLGTHPLQTMDDKPVLPILIKLIDAREDLSVQVHPDDEYALVNENGSLGKTEMWYVLDAKPGSEMVFGFKRDVNEEQVKLALNRGTFSKLLNHVPIHKNDIFYVEAGTVHAIGAGALVAEIQESSNLTYRFYDYERVDRNGFKRPLHVEKALEVANLRSSAVPRQPMRVLRYRVGCATELLTRCKYFQVERILLNTETCRNLVEYKTKENSFHAILCVDGCGSVTAEEFSLNFFKGDCVFIPSDSAALLFHGRAQLLDVSC